MNMTGNEYECPLLTDRYSQQECAMFALGAWIWDMAPWQTFATFTYKPYADGSPVGIARSRSTMKDYTCLITPRGHKGVFVLERGSMGGRLHWHGLLTEDWQEVKPWPYGYSKVESVMSEKASYYISKYLVKDQTDLLFRVAT